MAKNYYNEHDKNTAAWLRELIKAGAVAPGDVDERSIEDVLPSDLVGYTQHHFFAGIGIWSYALRRAGWPDDRQVWTASCPCQPFSAAGKGDGFADERHLWPALYHLICQCRPARIVGEQVASKDAGPWIDLVQTDLEALDYPFRALPFPAAGLGAPHIRDRLYWAAGVALGNAAGGGFGEFGRALGAGSVRYVDGAGGAPVGLADHDSNGCRPGREGSPAMGHGQAAGANSGAGGLPDASGGRHWPANPQPDQRPMARSDGALQAEPGQPRPVNGFWRAADWLGCRDGKFRPVEPGTFPLVAGAPARVVRLRGYGNGLNAQAAQAFIEALIEGEVVDAPQ